MSLRYKKRVNELYFEIGGNLAFYDQLWEVKEDEDMANLMNPYTRQTHQKDYFYSMYLTDGLYQVDGEILNSPRLIGVTDIQMGDIKYIDSNGDGKVDDSDKRRIGKPDSPHLNYGIDFRVNYKAWSVSGLIQGTGERYVDLGLGGIPAAYIFREYQLDYWNFDNIDARFPRVTQTTNRNNLRSDYWIENAAYIRLKNLQLRYDLKNKLLRNFNGISTFQITLTGTNLLTISDVYKYFDPESVMTEVGKDYTGNVSGIRYPIQKTFSLGINVEF